MNEELLRDGLAQTTLHPLGLRVEHAKGSRLTLENGKEIIDFISGIGASSFGPAIRTSSAPSTNRSISTCT